MFQGYQTDPQHFILHFAYKGQAEAALEVLAPGMYRDLSDIGLTFPTRSTYCSYIYIYVCRDILKHFVYSYSDCYCHLMFIILV